MVSRFLILSLLLISMTLSAHSDTLTPREAAMQIAMGGWGDIGESSIVRTPNNGGLYSLKIHWKDDPASDTPFWYLSWYATAKDYTSLSVDVLVESNNGKAEMPIYLQESDGDRWVSHLNLISAEIGKWHHYEFKKEQFSFWDLGDKKQNWDDVSGIVLEPSGKDGEITLFVDNLILKGPNGSKDLLDPSNLPKAYANIPTTRYPLNKVSPSGRAYIAGSANFWTYADNLNGICSISPSIGISSGGSTTHDKSGLLSKRLSVLGCPLMQEHQDSQDFEVELTEAGAWCERWDGESNNKTPGKFDKGHSGCICNPKFMAMNKRRVDAIIASGINTLTLVDFVWPYWGGRWGYSEADVNAYRKALSGTDGGLRLIDRAGRRTISFWDYFKDYSGYVMKPSDLGIKSWNEYKPTTENEAWPDNGAKRRNMYLFVTLNHYQWLKFLDELGSYIESKGGHLWIEPNPEDLGDAADYVYAAHLAGLQGNLPEYFGNPIWTEAIYRSGGYLNKNAREGSRLVGPILETNAGGHGKPYYDAEVSYAVAYDLCASMNAAVIKNDFLDESPFNTISDPANASQFDRFRDAMSKVHAFDQFKKDKPIRPRSSIAVVTPRNINRYRGDLFYGFGATDNTYDGSLGDALSKEGFFFDMMDTIGYAPIEEHRVVFWGVPEAPIPSVERIRKWLASNPANVLVCSSYQPTRRITGLGYCPWITPQDFIENPLGGKSWGLPAISKDATFKSGTIDAVKAPFADLFKVGESIAIPDGIYTTRGGRVLLSVSGRPLVSEFKGPGGSKVIYLHYRAGEPQNSALDRKISSAIASHHGGKRLADSVDNIIVHSYGMGTGSAHVLWDRKSLNEWEFIYDGNRKQRLVYSNPAVESMVRIPVAHKGTYVIYDVFNNTSTTLMAENTVDLNLKGRTCAVYYVLQSGKAADIRIAQLQKMPIHKLLAMGK